MRLLARLSFFFLLTSVFPAIGQDTVFVYPTGVRPNQFTEETNPSNSNFELYSQKNGLPRRATLLNLKKYFDQNLTISNDTLYLSRADSNDFVFLGTYSQTLSLSGDTLTLSDGNFVVLSGYADNITASQGIQRVSDDIRLNIIGLPDVGAALATNDSIVIWDASENTATRADLTRLTTLVSSEIDAGSTVYNANDTLSSDRTITGNNRDLNFDGIDSLSIDSRDVNIVVSEEYNLSGTDAVLATDSLTLAAADELNIQTPSYLTRGTGAVLQKQNADGGAEYTNYVFPTASPGSGKKYLQWDDGSVSFVDSASLLSASSVWLKTELEGGNSTTITSDAAGLNIYDLTILRLWGDTTTSSYIPQINIIPPNNVAIKMVSDTSSADWYGFNAGLTETTIRARKDGGNLYLQTAEISSGNNSEVYAPLLSQDTVGIAEWANWTLPVDTPLIGVYHLEWDSGTPSFTSSANDTTFLVDTDYNISQLFKSGEVVALSTSSSATSDSQLGLPTASASQAGKEITLISFDDHGTHDVTISAVINQLLVNGTPATTYDLSDGEIVRLVCVKDEDSDNYYWVLNRDVSGLFPSGAVLSGTRYVEYSSGTPSYAVPFKMNEYFNADSTIMYRATSNTGVTATFSAGSATISVPSGVFLDAVYVKGATGDLDGSNNYTVNIQTASTAFNTGALTIFPPVVQVVNEQAAAAPSTGTPYTYNQNTSPGQQITSVGSGDIQVRITGLNTYSNWGILIRP